LTRCGYRRPLGEELLPDGLGGEQAGRVVQVAARVRDVGRRVVAGPVLVPGRDVRGPQGFDHVEVLLTIRSMVARVA
jgi:hypothetical protein